MNDISKRGEKMKKRVDSDIAEKLEYALKRGLSVHEACCYSKIPDAVYMMWVEKNPQFALRMEFAKSNLICSAKLNLAKKIEEGDLAECKNYIKEQNAVKKDDAKRPENVGENPFRGMPTAQLVKLLGGDCNFCEAEQRQN